MIAGMSRAVKMLLHRQWITREQFEQAMVMSSRYGETPGYHLIQMGAISDEDLTDFFTRHFSLKYRSRAQLRNIPDETISIMSAGLVKHLRVLPIVLAGQNLTMGLTDPSLTHVAEEAAFHTKLFINPVLLSESDMTWALGRYYHIYPVDRTGLSMKPPAVLERETYELIPPEFAEERRKVDAVVSVTDAGWNLDEWGIGDVYADDDDDAIPLNSPKPSKLSSANRGQAFAVMSSSRPSLFSVPSEARVTLPPPATNRESLQPQIRNSYASMMLNSSAPEYSPQTDEDNQRDENSMQKLSEFTNRNRDSKSTDDLLIPKSIREQYQRTSILEEKLSERINSVVAKKTISEIIDTIKNASNRDDIVSSSLDFLLLFARRAAFLLVKKDEIRGYEIRGDETNHTAIKSYWIPYESESIFRKAAEDRSIHLGPFGRSVSDAVFSAALGGRPSRALIIPVVIRDRTAGLLYADKLRVDMPPWNLLERIAEVTGDSLLRLLTERKKT